MKKLLLGDTIEQMKTLDDKSIDLILCDLPYGTTANKWDKIIDFNLLWEQYERIIKDDGIICLFGSQPFTSKLIMSNLNLYRYNWVWEKEGPTGFLNSAYKPLQKTEDIVIFSKGTVGSLSKNPIKYNPQGVVEINKTKRNNPNSTLREGKGYPSKGNVLNSDKEYVQKYTNYPNNILKFSRDKEIFHKTQKPVELLKYLIRTYSNEGDVVLDNTMGSGSTGLAALTLGRSFIGIELDEHYFNVATKRLENLE